MRDVYIELKEYVKFTRRKVIFVKDIANVYARENLKNKVMNVPVDKGENDIITISALETISMIKSTIANTRVVSVGAKETIVYFVKPEENSKKQKVFKAIEMTLGVLLVGFGSFVAIMTFQTDVSLPIILKQIYKFFTGVDEVKPLLIQIPYSIGIFVGAITFFTKFKRTKVSPLEIAIDKYEKDIKDSEVKLLTKQQGKL